MSHFSNVFKERKIFQTPFFLIYSDLILKLMHVWKSYHEKCHGNFMNPVFFSVIHHPFKEKFPPAITACNLLYFTRHFLMKNIENCEKSCEYIYFFFHEITANDIVLFVKIWKSPYYDTIYEILYNYFFLLCVWAKLFFA